MTDTPLKGSVLARLQQGIAIGVMGGAVIWVWWFWPRHPGWAVAGAMTFVFAHAVVLMVECVIGALINRQDPAPTAGWKAWLGAWWSESRVAPLVFAWRQPFRWRRLPDDNKPAGKACAAVVLVHGFVCNRGFWLPWMNVLRAQGVPYVSVNLEPAFGSIDAYDSLIEDAVQRAERITGLPPILICHSMGGLAVRAWLSRQPVQQRVRAVITIGTPHRGTWLGRLSHVTNGRQMQPGCQWLVALEKREQERSTSPYADFVCWYSNTDNIVFPASTATLPGADNRLLEGAAHVAMAFHPTVMAESMMLVRSASAPV